MNRLVLSLLAVLAAGGAAHAASAINLDSEQQTIVVTEGGSRTEIVIGPGESVEFCPTSCFVTFPNGDRQALTGSETIEIAQGRGRIR